MGFFKTGDSQPVVYFDDDGKELSKEELKEISSEEKESQEDFEEENENSEEG